MSACWALTAAVRDCGCPKCIWVVTTLFSITTGLWGRGDVLAARQRQYMADLEAQVHSAVAQLDACYAQNLTNMFDIFTMCKVCQYVPSVHARHSTPCKRRDSTRKPAQQQCTALCKRCH